MPNYGTVPQSGLGSGVGPTQLQPGDSMLLFGKLVNGVVTGETPTNGISSIAIQRGLGPINTPAGIVFEVQAAARTILILGDQRRYAGSVGSSGGCAAIDHHQRSRSDLYRRGQFPVLCGLSERGLGDGYCDRAEVAR